MTMMRPSCLRRLAWTAVLLAGAACQRGPDPAEGERLVRAYVAKVIEAYRVSDSQIVDPLVGDEQGLKLLGLIGVKRDMGITLDAQLLELVVERVEATPERIVVVTRERWQYRDRRIGSGDQVGEASIDSYQMRYRFERPEGRWLLQELSFESEPVVGRKVPSPAVDSRVLHGLPSAAEEAAEEAAEAARQAAEARKPGRGGARP